MLLASLNPSPAISSHAIIVFLNSTSNARSLRWKVVVSCGYGEVVGGGEEGVGERRGDTA